MPGPDCAYLRLHGLALGSAGPGGSRAPSRSFQRRRRLRPLLTILGALNRIVPRLSVAQRLEIAEQLLRAMCERLGDLEAGPERVEALVDGHPARLGYR